LAYIIGLHEIETGGIWELRTHYPLPDPTRAPLDAGVEGRGIKRKAGGKRTASEAGVGGGKKSKKGKGQQKATNECGDEWDDGEEFEVEAIVGTRLSAGPKADKSERYPKGTTLYRVIWKDYAVEAATWEPAENISDALLDEYEAGLEAEAELEAEEELELQPPGGG